MNFTSDEALVQAAKALKRDRAILVALLIAMAAFAVQLLYTALCCA